MRGIAVQMTKPLLKALAEHHENEAREFRQVLAKASCKTCFRWQAGHCRKFDVVPPPDIQKAGCDDYEFDEIPF